MILASIELSTFTVAGEEAYPCDTLPYGAADCRACCGACRNAVVLGSLQVQVIGCIDACIML
jgi:hypothetical protein